MARSTANKTYRTFVGGLITEASALAYPENASIDEDNMLLFKKGNRTRRFGVDYETGWSYPTPTLAKSKYEVDGYVLRTYTWFSANNDSSLNFLVFQKGDKLEFYKLDSGPVSSTYNSAYDVNLGSYIAPEKTIAYDEPLEFASGKGFLFVAGKNIEPLAIEYDPVTDTMSVQVITIQIRDFIGVNDGLANDEEPTTLSNEHLYNLRNQGWIDAENTGSSSYSGVFYDHYEPIMAQTYTAPDSGVITSYYNATGRYPGNNKQWWSSKDSAGNFDPNLLKNEYFGNTLAPRGHYIVDAFNKDRSSISGISGLTVESTEDRPEATSFFAGRVWYGQGSDIYFSQVLTSKKQAGSCYQEADPTNGNISELIDSDGGHIPIPAARNIKKLVEYASGIIVMAENGVWFISGGDSGFSANSYLITRVSSIGVDSRLSVVEANGKVFWWSQSGIHAVEQQDGAFGPIKGALSTGNISKDTIQAYFNDTIPAESRALVQGFYDSASNRVQWLWASASCPVKWGYNRILNYDLSLGAFYPWSTAEDPASSGPFICGVFQTPTISSVSGSEDVTDSSGAIVTNSSNANVTASDPGLDIRNTELKYAFIDETTPGSYSITFGLFDNSRFSDWEEFNKNKYSATTGFAYDSYIVTGYEIFDDTMRDKQIEYLFAHFNKTETAFVADGSGGYTVDFPSSCSLSTRWGWADVDSSNRWTGETEAYRHKRVPFVDPSDLVFDNGFNVVTSKNRVRGKGPALQFRFRNNKIGSNFDLLGWSISVTGNTSP